MLKIGIKMCLNILFPIFFPFYFVFNSYLSIFAEPALAESPLWGKARVGAYTKRRNCTLWFWRLRTWKIHWSVKNKATGTPYGVYIHCILNIFRNCMFGEVVRVYWLYISSWGFRRCSFRLIGQFQGLKTWSEHQAWLHAFLYMYVSS